MSPLDELAKLLRPAGGGVYLVSTGAAEQEAMQRKLYGARDAAEVQERFRAALGRIVHAKGVLLAIPSDTGAGFRRGANLGPQGIRERLLLEHPDWPARCEAMGLVDVGDVFVVPQLLHDEMLGAEQVAKARKALYGDAGVELPVSALSIAERALDLVFSLNPGVKVFVLGGDHSCAWPAVAAIAKARAKQGGAAAKWGIVQSDAHTDLLEERLGVRICFGTWSWHANELVGRQGRLVQVGIRASRRDRSHWESTLGVRQFWAKDVLANPAKALDEAVAHVKSLGLSGVYFSNDIDGTDARHAMATGTPEPGGLEPEWLVELVRRLGREVGILGGDLMEVAPPLGPTGRDVEETLRLSVRYVVETVTAALGSAR